MLSQALELEGAGLVSLVGAGGKTNLMFALAREAVAQGRRVLVTTTTKIAAEEAEGPWPAFAADGAEMVLEKARQALGRASGGAVIAYSAKAQGDTRLAGLAPECVDALAAGGFFDLIVVEADGAARKPLKAPAAHEPVVPAATDAFIMVAGLNGLGRPLDAGNLFRPELWAERSGDTLGEPITPKGLANVVLHEEGLTKGCPPGARRILFLNRADTNERRAAAERIFGHLADAPGPKPRLAAYGRLLPEPEVRKVVKFSLDAA